MAAIALVAVEAGLYAFFEYGVEAILAPSLESAYLSFYAESIVDISQTTASTIATYEAYTAPIDAGIFALEVNEKISEFTNYATTNEEEESGQRRTRQ